MTSNCARRKEEAKRINQNRRQRFGGMRSTGRKGTGAEVDADGELKGAACSKPLAMNLGQEPRLGLDALLHQRGTRPVRASTARQVSIEWRLGK